MRWQGFALEVGELCIGGREIDDLASPPVDVGGAGVRDNCRWRLVHVVIVRGVIAVQLG